MHALMGRRRSAFNAAVGGSSNASGIALPSDNVSGWTLTMAEDFGTSFAAGGVASDGTFPAPYASTFFAYADATLDTSGKNNGTNSIFKPSTNLSCTGSKMVTLCNVVSGQIRSATYVVAPGGNYGQLYGRFSVCFRVPTSVHGFKIAFLMWPNSDVWPRDSELDWPEGSLNNAFGVYGANFLHQGTTGTGGTPGDFDRHRYGVVPAPDGAWHVATLEWASGFVRAMWDGVTVGTSYDRVANTSMYWAIQTESDVDSYPGANYATTGDTGTVELDWVACWNANSPTVPGSGSAPSSTNTLTEAFTGTSGNWNTGRWTSVTTTTGASATLSTNQGLVTTGSVGGYGDTVYRRSTTTLPADSIITCTVNITNISECYPFIAFRDATSGTGTASGYQLYFYAATSQIVLANPGDTNVATINWTTFTTSTSIKVEILTQSGVTSIRLWAAAGSRPTNPSVQTNTSLYTGTTCGLGLIGGSAASSRTVRFDDFAIASIP